MSRTRLAGLVAALTTVMTPAQAQDPMSALERPETLTRFFDALDAAAAGEGERPVHILQLGDSHTVGDLITASVRSRLQNSIGRGGRGALPPGKPYALYQPRQVELFEQAWTAVTPGPGSAAMSGVGLSGSRVLIWGEGSSLRMEAEGSAAFSRIVLCGASGPAAGTLTVRAGFSETVVSFADAAAGAACREVRLGEPARSATLIGGTGAVDLHSVATFAEGPGVAVSALGVIGATLRDLAVRDPAVVRAELEAWGPDLIVLAFGTNEGFDPFLDPGAYEPLLRGQIARLRSLAPDADILILGAPDAQRPEGGGTCGDEETLWRIPRELPLVRDVQRRVAADMGVAFWDWHARMGGDCSAHRLATAWEPLMRGDHVHFNSAGGDWIGQMLSGDLTAAWRARAVPAAAEE
ncbi:GDSL-type esterase/lipase family protein [Brevundimonas sp.]|uniref:GDSL-type esterase/lipase family protein n=1 Tax=Brevundimonas sp. TaxID=1871086 RepID=UPI00391CEEB7